jgi:U4/U6 small nuclear ribonucleoprotein PRP3
MGDEGIDTPVDAGLLSVEPSAGVTTPLGVASAIVPDEPKADEPKTKKRRSRWGQEPEPAPMPDPSAMMLAMPGGVGMPPVMSSPMSFGGAPGGFGPVPMVGVTNFGSVPAGMDISSAASAAREALEKAKKAAMFQRQIHEQMNKLKSQGLAAGFLPGEGPKARKLILDEFGRELDEEGCVVPMKKQVVSTLKVNINREKENRLKKILGLKKEGVEKSYVDPTLRVRFADGGMDRPRRKTFQFIEQGDIIKREARIVKKLQEKALGIDKEREKKGKEEREAEKAKLKQDEKKNEPHETGGVKKIEPKILRREAIPDVEWWDIPFLYSAEDGSRRTYNEVSVDRITPYVEHPVPIKITTEKEVPEAPMMHLTPKERRKLRRLKRQERTQEIRDKIKMGILQAPPPKVKMSNLMRVLGDEVIADPSTVERKVRLQVEQRRREHEQRNEARKLPAEERKQKKIQKWRAETEPTTQVLVFKVRDLTNKRHLFKIDMNAQQFHLTGICITCTGVANIVIVEGGPRAVKRYRKLMLRRVKWTEDQRDEDDDDDSDDEGNVTAPKIQDHCVLVWEGLVKTRSFKQWKVIHARSEQEARKTLCDRGAEHYWEMLARFRDSRIDI